MTAPISATPLDDSIEFSLAELCSVCRVEESLVVEIVAEGIVEPIGLSRAQWRFSGLAVTRVLALELFEELERLRRTRR
jgi:hypothetical protein